MRGTMAAWKWGASPRGRRNPRAGRSKASKIGCISAWAEEPGADYRRWRDGWVHLRVGGGTRRLIGGRDGCQGASPRGRRNRFAMGAPSRDMRCISAWAEEPHVPDAFDGEVEVHLRVGGGTAFGPCVTDQAPGASPRGRRNPRGDRVSLGDWRCISAWAEEPRPPLCAVVTAAVHLRVGGGTQ